MLSKRGLEPVVTTALIILITIVASGMVAVVTLPTIQENLNNPCADAIHTIHFVDTEYSCYTSASGNQRGSTGFSVKLTDTSVHGFRIAFTKDGTTRVADVKDGVSDANVAMLGKRFGEPLEVVRDQSIRTYVLSDSYEQIEISPILENRVCQIKQTVNVARCRDPAVTNQLLAAQEPAAPAVCGNGEVEMGEQCDGQSETACFATNPLTGRTYAGTRSCSECAWSPCVTEMICGDGAVNGDEHCEVGEKKSCDYTNPSTGHRYTGLGLQGCNAQTCTFDAGCSAPVNARCGNGIIDAGSTENCDGAIQAATDCMNYIAGSTFTGGTLRCSAQCYFDTSQCTGAQAPVCGNNQLDMGETCDNGISSLTRTASCTTSLGYAGTKTCNAACSAYSSCSTSLRCGDGILNGNEQCDDGNANTNDACTNTCTAARCGDGVVQHGSEQCDAGDIETSSCSASCQIVSVPDIGEIAINRVYWSITGAAVHEFVQITIEATTDASGKKVGLRIYSVNALGFVNKEIPSHLDSITLEKSDKGSGASVSWEIPASEAGSNLIALAYFVDDISTTIRSDNELRVNALTPQPTKPICAHGDGVCRPGCTADDDNDCAIIPAPAVCGNGILESGEYCDDNNGIKSDGCSSCAVQSGWQCTGAPSMCTQITSGSVCTVLSATWINDLIEGGNNQGHLILEGSDACEGPQQINVGLYDADFFAGDLLIENTEVPVFFTQNMAMLPYTFQERCDFSIFGICLDTTSEYYVQVSVPGADAQPWVTSNILVATL